MKELTSILIIAAILFVLWRLKKQVPEKITLGGLKPISNAVKQNNLPQSLSEIDNTRQVVDPVRHIVKGENNLLSIVANNVQEHSVQNVKSDTRPPDLITQAGDEFFSTKQPRQLISNLDKPEYFNQVKYTL